VGLLATASGVAAAAYLAWLLGSGRLCAGA